MLRCTSGKSIRTELSKLELVVLHSQGNVPRSAAEALQCPHGRPPLPLLAFGFGGRAVILQLRSSPPMGTSMEASPARGVLHVLPLNAAATQLGSGQQSAGEDKV